MDNGYDNRTGHRKCRDIANIFIESCRIHFFDPVKNFAIKKTPCDRSSQRGVSIYFKFLSTITSRAATNNNDCSHNNNAVNVVEKRFHFIPRFISKHFLIYHDFPACQGLFLKNFFYFLSLTSLKNNAILIKYTQEKQVWTPCASQ